MAQSVKLWGATYSNVPAITVPKSTTGTCRFDDASVTTATASDVASGKIFLASDGTITTGTASGGGSGIGALLTTYTIGAVSTSSTSATDLGKSTTVSNIHNYDLLIIDVEVDTKTNGRHVETIRTAWITAGTNITTHNGATLATATWNAKAGSSGTVTSRTNTTPYGVYAYSVSVSSTDGKATIAFYSRYNSTQTGTINGSYTARIYGVKLYDY